MHKVLTQRMRKDYNHDGERGAAIVAAIGVMIICISLGVLIVSQAISTQRDSGRNRARTAEIHTAEGGVDTLHAKLQNGEFICEWYSGERNSIGPDQVDAVAKILYWDADGKHLPCTGESLPGTHATSPARAKILVTSTANPPTLAGIEPERSFESEVILSEVRHRDHSAAIFSGAGFNAPNGGIARGDGADVWVNDGNYHCSVSFQIDGNLYVVNGKAGFDNACGVKESAYVSESIVMNNDARIDGDAYVRRHGITFGNSTAFIYGNAIIKGAAGGGGYGEGNSIKGRLSAGMEPQPFPEQRDFPSVKYKASDWLNADSDRWQIQQEFTNSEWREYLKEQATQNGADFHSGFVTGAQCGQFDRANWSFGGDLDLPAIGTVIDSRECVFRNASDFTINVYADTVIFAKGFELNNNVKFQSGDGQPHALWLIVPDENLGSCQWFGSTLTTFDYPLTTFAYAPCQVNMNTGAMDGQIYGNPVHIDVEMNLDYVPLGIPGVDLMPGHASPEGNWNVDVVYKRETSERVEVN